ncbi:hypothetical protein B0H11DRAFT_2185980 [Mycena galericulata]|nr:hypothetical protein B0H11DRAFT_2185980 [Mycena galericulata]
MSVPTPNYEKELSDLLEILKHNFIDYTPSQNPGQTETQSVKAAVSHDLEMTFSPRNANGTVLFKSHGAALEAVVQVLHKHITGTTGANILLATWDDDLLYGVCATIDELAMQIFRGSGVVSDSTENVKLGRKIGLPRGALHCK